MNRVKKLFYSTSLFFLCVNTAYSDFLANIELYPDAIEIRIESHVDRVSVNIIDEHQFSFNKVYETSEILLELRELKLPKNGNFRYEITGIKFTGETLVDEGNGRPTGSMEKRSITESISGKFKVNDYEIFPN